MEILRTERTNFDGSWNDLCPHCGNPQEDHRLVEGPYAGVTYELRLPCQPEKDRMRQKTRRTVRAAKNMILIGWILVPLIYLLLQQFVAWVGWVAFGFGILQLGLVTIRHFGDPDRWIPGHKKKKEEEANRAHFIWHCERNPEGFARLRNENFLRAEAEAESAALRRR